MAYSQSHYQEEIAKTQEAITKFTHSLKQAQEFVAEFAQSSPETAQIYRDWADFYHNKLNFFQFCLQVISKLHAEGLSLSSPWAEIETCLSRTVSSTRCIAAARRLVEPRPVMQLQGMTDQQYQEILAQINDIRYLIVKAGGMATKTRTEEVLMTRYGLDRGDAHTFVNLSESSGSYDFTIGRDVVRWTAVRPEPKLADWPEIKEVVQ